MASFHWFIFTSSVFLGDGIEKQNIKVRLDEATKEASYEQFYGGPQESFDATIYGLLSSLWY